MNPFNRWKLGVSRGSIMFCCCSSQTGSASKAQINNRDALTP